MKVQIREIKPEDNPKIARIIQTVMPEMGAGGLGFAIHDDEVSNMYSAYQSDRNIYFVCEVNGRVLGGGGIAPLAGADPGTCELKKMYFLPEARGKGYGQQVLNACLKAAGQKGFSLCYLETFNTMKDAMKLYEKNGFTKIDKAMGNTGHFACDTFYQLPIPVTG